MPKPGEVLLIKSIGSDTKIKAVSLLGSKSQLNWEQTTEGLSIVYPAHEKGKFVVGFKVAL